MSLTGIAAMIAAVSFAVLALTAVYVAARLSGPLGEAVALVRGTRARMDELCAAMTELSGQVTALASARESAGRAAGPQARADERTDERGARNEPQARRERVGPERAVGPSEPWSTGERAKQVAYGVRYAVGLRRGSRRRTLPGEVVR